jgi:hypothetical protein
MKGLENPHIEQFRRRQPTACVPSEARGTIFNGTLIELKYNNYDLTKRTDFFILMTYFMFDLSNCFVLQNIGLPVLTKYAFDTFVIKFQNNVFRTKC